MVKLDAVSNAKTYGLIIIVIGVIRLLSVSPLLLESSTYDNPLSLILGLLLGGGLVVFGIGFRKLKKWSLYGYIIYTIIILLINIYQIINAQTGLGNFLLNLFLLGGSSVWFYKAKSKFT